MPDINIPEYVKELQQTTQEIRELVESGKAKSAEGKEMLEKLETKANELETVNQGLTSDLADETKKREELEETVNGLQKKIYRIPGASTREHSEICKSFEDFLRKGKDHMDPRHKTVLTDYFKKAYVRTDVNPDGGFLMPTEWSSEIEKNITEISELRPFARVTTIGAKSYFVPVRTSLLASQMTGEGQALLESISQFGGVEIFPKKITAKTPISMEAIEDYQFNLEAEIRSDFSEEILRQEGYQFLKGSGPLGMKGIMNNPLVTVVNSGVANDITADTLIDVTGELKTGYRPLFAFNRRTLAKIRKFKSGTGEYIWTPTGASGLAPGVPNEINGFQYIILPDLDDTGTDTFPILYADFQKFRIVDRIGMMVSRDFITEADNDKVVFRSRKRTGCDITLPEAFIKVKCAA